MRMKYTFCHNKDDHSRPSFLLARDWHYHW